MDRLATRATSSTATCHCKAIKLTFPTPTEKLNECHCTICRRYGALWAYYNPKDVQIEGPKTDTYQFGEKNNDFHRCPSCGCMTHKTDAKDENATEMGVNCNMLEKEELRRFERTVDEHGDAPPFKVNNVPDEYEPWTMMMLGSSGVCSGSFYIRNLLPWLSFCRHGQRKNCCLWGHPFA